MTITRQQVSISGAVQGVGFRPFVYRLAGALGLSGSVINTPQGVLIEVEGEAPTLEAFIARLRTDKPPMAVIHELTVAPLPALHVPGAAFTIRESAARGGKRALIMPEMALCPDCLRELFDPNDRRYRYPFINCTNCGPRFTLIQALPYDRPVTTMSRFTMCPDCRAEYEAPLDRRFHAQPNACPRCGPHLTLWDAAGATLATHDAALRTAEDALRSGQIVAVKGLGGFQLMVDARDEAAVQRLRDRKRRPHKPLAVLMPTLAATEAACHVDDIERALLTSRQAPIVLLRRREAGSVIEFVTGSVTVTVAESVAPGSPTIGVMLPYTPLQHLLMADLGFPVVATSGNLSGEPICIDETEALDRLSRKAAIADLFLVHDCPIERHMDDSVVQVAAGRPMVLRRARGYAPLPLHLRDGPAAAPIPPIVATGEQLKNTIAITTGAGPDGAVDGAVDIFLSQHIGDMETVAGQAAARRVLADLRRMYAIEPVAAACSTHPDSFSRRHAEALGLPIVAIQHHEAHVLAAIAEHGLHGPVLGIAWDGTGYGDDGTIWGGECLAVNADFPGYQRVGTLVPFRLPGGEAAIREPRRTALALLIGAYGEGWASAIPTGIATELAALFTPAELRVLPQAIAKGLNAPITTSMGRVFDGVAALLGLWPRVSFEGQAAMALEALALPHAADAGLYPAPLLDGTSRDNPDSGPFRIDWRPLIRAIVADRALGVDRGVIAARFHGTLASLIETIARRVSVPQVVLTGGCFQNRTLLEAAVRRLDRAGFRVCWPQAYPPNDGGIALGQVLGALRNLSARPPAQPPVLHDLQETEHEGV